MMPRTRRGPGVRVSLFLISLVGSTLFTGINGQTTSPAGDPPRITSTWDSVIQLTYGERLPPMDCQAEGTPTPAVSWRREGTSQVLDNPISFPYASYTQEGTYTCVATSLDFPPATKNVTIDVKGPPDIDGPENVTVRASSGEEVRLECTARGDPKVVEIEWFVGRGRAQPVRPGGEEYTMEKHLSASPPKSVLVINKMKDTLANKYTCWALNASGQKDIKHFDVQFSRSESRIGGKEGAIAGGVLGALLIMTVVAVVVFYLWKRKQKQPQNMADKDGSNYDFHELEAELEAQD